MHSMLHILVLLICCNLIADTAGTTHTTTAAVTSMLATASQRHMPHNWLRRQRRYLLFEKGSTVGVQMAGTKAILPEHPRGLYQIFEATANYELPASLDDLWPQRTKAHSSATTTTTTKDNVTTSAAAKHKLKLGAFSGSNGYSIYNNNNNSYDEMWLPTWHATDDWPAAAATMPTWWQVPGQRRQWLSAHNKQQQLHRKQQQQQQQQQQHRKQQQQHRKLQQQQYGKQQQSHSKQQQQKNRKQQPRRKQQQTRKQYFARQQHRFPSALQVAKSLTFAPPILSRQFAAHSAVHQHSVCPRRNVYGNWQDNNVDRGLCAADSKTLGRGRKRRSVAAGDDSVGVGNGVAGGKENNNDDVHRFDERPDEFHFATNAERIFFDLLTQWTQVHNYPSHYCIMRTFCEARHVLLVRGQSLFHDLLRILIDAALPAALRHATYKIAISHDNLSDCAQHYATLCGLSFLQHFSEAVHGRFMQ